MNTTEVNYLSSNQFKDLVHEFEDYHRALIDCNPSESDEHQDQFFEIQEWGKKISRKARRYGISEAQLEEAADV